MTSRWTIRHKGAFYFILASGVPGTKILMRSSGTKKIFKTDFDEITLGKKFKIFLGGCMLFSRQKVPSSATPGLVPPTL